MSKCAFDRRAVTIDGKRILLLSGAIHYPRSTPGMWPELMNRSRQAGLNTIETYVFWNLHERRRGAFDFSGRLDLMRFLQLAQEYGLHVILRIGPYICAETNYGGLPAWLRDVPGVRMRTYNEPFMHEMARWVRFLCDYLRPMFAPNGGPIILAQIENEYGNVAKNYGEEGQNYLKWTIDFSQTLELGVPWIMCVGSAPGVIETINEFYAHKLLAKHFAAHPGQPALCTENWPSWYDVFGYPRHVRTTENLAYTVARFIAGGGTGMNYYMWHGGTNFGRETMYLQTTSYYSDAPLDELGLPTTKSHHLSRLHRIINDYQELLLNTDRPEPILLGLDQRAYVYGEGKRSLAFLCNDGETEATVSFEERSYALSQESVTLVADHRVLMNTAEVEPTSVIRRQRHVVSGLLQPFSWWPEPMPTRWPEALRSATVSDTPIEQLKLTQDETDYCWYTTKLVIASQESGAGMLTLKGVADLVYVFVDGKLKATSPGPLKEDRGPIDSDDFIQSFALELEAGEHELSLLCCAIGLIKGDWMIGHQNMAEERKGFWGEATWNDNAIGGPWHIQPGLAGETCRIFDKPHAVVQWRNDESQARNQPLRWWRTTFDRPAGDGPFVLDMQSMTKGLAWLNGHCIGRYWLIRSTERPCTCNSSVVKHVEIGQPTQRYYHLPSDWLAERNAMVLFEELGGDPSAVQLCRLS